ncbi:MAG TPA: AAA family ATPase [Ktedonobacteraceae bacterium]
MISTLHIQLLGGFQLFSGETPVSDIDIPRVQSLLAYVLLHSGAPQSRSHLAYLFWPDSTESQAHTNLRNVVHKLRQALPNADAFLQIDRQTLSWKRTTQDAPWTLDALDFEKAIGEAEQARDVAAERRALGRAMKLYRGDLLPGCYDEWILTERDRLRQAFLEALERLVDLQEQERDYEAAIDTAQHLLRDDPLREATYRRLMRLYATSGDRAAALRIYHTCSTVLERELTAQPSKATREIYERLLRTEGPLEEREISHPTLVAAAPLVGRQHEWKQLLSAWRTAAVGRPHFFLLCGEAGIGKTRLAEELLTWVERQGIASAMARCYATERELAYAPVTAWLRSDALQRGLLSLAGVWLTEVARLLPNLLVDKPGLPPPGPLTESWQRQRFFEALAHAVLQNSQPLLLLLDDVQWCDRETLEWLHYLLRFDQKAPLLLVGTERLEEMTTGHPLASLALSLRRQEQLTEVTLDPLNADETAYLAAHLTGEHLDPAVISALYQETEGNPLFVVETVRAGAVGKVKTGQLSLENSHARPGALLPPTVQLVISSRLAQLSPAAREVMGLAAVIGRAFTFDVLVRASSMDEDTLVPGLDELWQRRIVREQGSEAYDFSHDKLREQAYASLSAARRRLLHRRVGEALVSLHANDADTLDALSGQIATHYEQAGAVEQAILYYERAAGVAQQVYANTDALVAYRRILRLLEQLPLSESKREWCQEMAARCDECIGDILTLTGEFEAARDAYQNALTQAPEQDRVRRAGLQRKIAKSWELQLHFEEALHAYSTAETALGQEPAASAVEWWQEWIELQDKKMDLHGMLAQMGKVYEILEKMRPIVQQYGTPMQRAEFFISSALTASRLDRFRVSEEILDEARAGLAAYEALGDPVKIGWSHLSLGNLFQFQDNLTGAEGQVREALALGERTGDALLHMRSLSTLALVYRKRGQVEDVRRAASRALAMAAAMDQSISVCLNKANLAWVAWREGKLSEAWEYGRAALAEWQSLPTANYTYYSQWTALLPVIDIELAHDQLSQAVDYARMLLAPGQQVLPDVLTANLEAAIRAWDDDQPDMARKYLQQTIISAQESGYL